MRHLEDIGAEVNQSLKVCLVFECIKESDNYQQTGNMSEENRH